MLYNERMISAKTNEGLKKKKMRSSPDLLSGIIQPLSDGCSKKASDTAVYNDLLSSMCKLFNEKGELCQASRSGGVPAASDDYDL